METLQQYNDRPTDRQLLAASLLLFENRCHSFQLLEPTKTVHPASRAGRFRGERLMSS
jgi:hypothetical protein